MRWNATSGWLRRNPKVAAATCLAVLAAVATTAAVLAPKVAHYASAPAVQAGPSVVGVIPVQPHIVAPPDRAGTTSAAAAVTWPAARTVSIPLRAPGDGQREGLKVRVAGSPVWAQAIDTGESGIVQARVVAHDTAVAAGASGVLLDIDTSGVATGSPSRQVRVGLDYGTFAQANGGNFGGRLHLVQLPSCALTRPNDLTCRTQTPVPGTNDPAAQTVSATVTGAHVLLAATADAGSPGGTYAATSLKPSGSWTAGDSTGSFGYNYPIEVPPAPSQLAPKVALSYNSSSVDGQTASTSAQSSWVGDGWATADSYVEQSFVSCSDQPEGSAAPVSIQDNCYDGPILTLSLNGSSTALVWDATKSAWKPQQDHGEVVTHVTNSGNGTGTYNTDYWTVTERNGTLYRFGVNHLPGWVSGKSATNSVDSEPVYSAHSGDPCYNATFSSAVCTTAYRWHLDYATDVHGNAMAYYYQQDTNFYGRYNGASNVSYVRDSRLSHIDYGFTDGNAYGTVPDQVVFGTSGRCVVAGCSPLSATTKANWKDVPYDLVCASGTTCTSHSPAFFSTARLTSITSQQYSTASSGYLPVDSYALTQTMPDTGDSTSPTLWLSSITRTGSDLTGGGSAGSITTPAVTFTGVPKQNRVDTVTDGLPAFYRYRVNSVTTETGSVITPTYTLVNPCTAPVTVNKAANTTSCYPVSWTPDGYTTPFFDWFNKYAVTKVTQTDPTGLAPQLVTNYNYVGGAAWHYDDNEMVKAKYRTYGQFRGYATVQTLTGDGLNDAQTLSETHYYRGMSNNNNTVAVTLTDSLGGTHDDANQLSGSALETTAYVGNGGPVDNSTITSYWISAATASRIRTGLPTLTANWVQTAETYKRQAVTSSTGTTWRYDEVDDSYDASTTSLTIGLLQHTYTHTSPTAAAYDGCLSRTYAALNTSANLVGLVSEAETDAVACGGYTANTAHPSTPATLNTLTAPATVNRPAQVATDTRTYYDDTHFSTTFPQTGPPTYGDVTMLRQATDYTAGAFAFTTIARSSYDSIGRLVAAYDANGNATTTSYTANAVGLTVSTTATNPLGHTVTQTFDTARGLVLTTTDPNLVVTTDQYDALGRSTAVWLASRTISQPANLIFSYLLSKTAAPAATSQTMNDGGGYATSTLIYDAMLRPRQTQAFSPQSGRIITDTFYDSRGWVSGTYNGWWDPATTPNTSLVSAANLHDLVHNQDAYTYDGLGRAVQDRNTDAGDPTTAITTTTVYNGDRTTTVPPAGGVVSTSVTDPLGRVAELDQYSAAPTVNIPTNTFTGAWTVSGGTTVATHYGYDSHGNQATLTDASGNTWTSVFNLRGQITSKTDPDAGTTTAAATMVYDGNGNVTQTTDSRGRTTSGTYDALNRKTAAYDAPTASQTTSNQLAAWIYDNSNNVAGVTRPIGHLTTEISYNGGAAYTVQQKKFNVFGKSQGVTVTIPSAAGTGLAGTYAYTSFYSTNAGLLNETDYTAHGGLPAENVLYGYQGPADLPDTVGGNMGYSDGVTYDEHGRVNQQALGVQPNRAYVTNTYDNHTGRLTRQLVTRAVATPGNVDQEDYTYDNAGDLTRQSSTRLGAATPTETRCYTYDGLARLTNAWTATDACATTPTPTNRSMVGDSLGSSSSYWTSWTFDVLGNRTQQTDHGPASAADTATSYTYNGNSTGQPHTLTSTSTTGASTASTSYAYDSAGDMTTRNAGLGNQTLTWDDTGKLTSVTGVSGTTSYVYDADGNILLQKDPGTTTLYLPGEQLVLNTSSGTVTGTRYYPLPGGQTAVRTGTATNAVTFQISDAHGTPTLYLDSTAQIPTWRQTTPYGAPRGGAVTAPDNHGFLNKPTNTYTGLTTLGARQYDPTTARFASLDPVLDPKNPQQLNGYSYANNNPLGFSDPTGLNDYDQQTPCAHYDCGPGNTDQSDTASQNATNNDKNGWISPLVAKTRRDFVLTVCNFEGHCGGRKNVIQNRPKSDPSVKAFFDLFTGQGGYGDTCTMNHDWAPCEVAENMILEGVDPAEVVEFTNNYCNYLYCSTKLSERLSGVPPVSFPPGWHHQKSLEELGEDALNGLGVVEGARGSDPEDPMAACNSFSPDTKVLLADGATRKLKDIHIGDKVAATNPETGKTSPQYVTALHASEDVDLTDLTVVDLGGHEYSIHTTQKHPFWSDARHTWIDAANLRPGEELRTIGMGTVRVAGLSSFSGLHPMLNLTISIDHTYYVIAGTTPVLVHNAPIGICPANGVTDHGKLAAFAMLDDLMTGGYVDIVPEVTFRASDGTPFRADFVARKPGGAWEAFESKGNTGGFTNGQEVGYPELQTGGAELRTDKLEQFGLYPGDMVQMNVTAERRWCPICTP